MSRLLWQRILAPRVLILELLLAGLVCVPLAARQSVRDAAISLLLPVSLTGALSAWGIAPLKSNERWKALLLATAGPLILFLYVGHTGGALLAAGRETLRMLPQAFAWMRERTPMEPYTWIAALNELSMHLSVLCQRLGVWLLYAARGVETQDPTARALAWSTGLWWLATWGGWQVRRQERVLAALLPSTALVGLLVNSNPKQMVLLWIHLAALLLLLGLTNYENRLHKWEQAARDYVEITRMYSLFSTAVLTTLLVGSAYLASTTSVKEFLDKLREERRPRAPAQAGPVATGVAPSSHRLATFSIGDLLRPHRITAGLELSHDVAMVISTGELPRMPREASPHATPYYWRTMTYETYSRAGWSNPASAIVEAPAGEALIESPPADYHVLQQQVHFPAGPTGRVYWTGTLLRLDVPMQTAWHGQPATSAGNDPLRVAELLSAFTTADSYTAESLRREVKEEDLRGAGANYPDWISGRYLALPDSVPERVLALARNITATAATPYDRARAIETYLRQFPYSLQVPAPPPGRDAADYFLFDLKKGYCDYYATAMVVLSRAAGLPARFVTGYASGSYDPESASYIVTGADAHSWAEIYFPGSGWVEFEATASLPLPYRQGEGDPGAAPASSGPSRQGLPGRLIFFVEQLMPAFWPAAGILLALSLIWATAGNWLLARLGPAQATRRFYRSMRRTARPLTGTLPASQTAHEYARALSGQLASFEKRALLARWIRPAGDELKTLTDLYTDSLFTLRPPARAQVLEAARAWSRLRWRLIVLGVISRVGEKSPREEGG